MTGFLAAVGVLLPFADPDLSYPLPVGADLRIAHPSRTHGPGCRAAAFSRDGTKLATMSDRSVLVRAWPSGRRLLELHFPRITHTRGLLAFSPDGRFVAAGEIELSRLVVGDLRTGDDWRLETERSDDERFELSHVAFVSNGLLRVFGERMNEKRQKPGAFEAVDFDPERAQPVARRELPGNPVAIAADGTTAILKVADELRRFDVTVSRFTGKGVKAPEIVGGIAVDASARRVVEVTDDVATVRDLHSGASLRMIALLGDLRRPPESDTRAVGVLSADGTELIVTRRFATEFVWGRWRVADGEELLAPKLPGGAWVLDGPRPSDLTAIGRYDGHVYPFDRATGKPRGLATRPYQFALSPGGRRLASDDGQFEVYDATTGESSGWNTDLRVSDARARYELGVSDEGHRVRVNNHPPSAALGRRKVTLGGDRLRVSYPGEWRPDPFDQIIKLPPMDEREWGGAFQLATSADGRTLAVARHTHVDLFDAEFRHLRRIQVIPLRDPVQQQLWSDIREQVTGIALSADGRRVAIGKHTEVQGMPLGTEFFLHEVATGGRVSRIDYEQSRRTPLGFTPNGRHLWTAGDGVALRYDLKPPKLPVFDRRNLLAELGGENAALAHLAAGRLASPGMLAWLGEQLPPDPKPDAARVADLIRKLSDRAFQAREDATAALVAMGPGVSVAMREVLKAPATPETRRRAEAVLGRVTGESAPGVRLRARAVAAVAMIAEDGDPAARALLHTWAKGDPGTPLTGTASATLARLRK